MLSTYVMGDMQYNNLLSNFHFISLVFIYLFILSDSILLVVILDMV